MFGLTPGIPNIAQAGVAVLPNVDVARWRAMLTAGLSNPASAAGLAIGAALGTAIAASVGAALQADRLFTPFEEQLTRMRTLAGESAESVEMLGAAVLEMAPQVGARPQELAEALQFIASSGFEGASALEVLDATARAAAVGMGNLSSIADAVTSAVNAWGEDTLTAADATDVLLRAVRAGKAEPDELAQSMGRVTGIAADMGVEFHEVAAAVAAMSFTGLDAAEATTALRAILTGLLNPSQQAAATLERLGLNAKDLRATLADDRQGLRTVLFELAEAFGENEEAAGQVFGNVRALAGVLNLTGAQAETTKQIFDELAAGIYSVDDAFAEVEGTNAFRRSAAQAETMAVLIGEGSEAAEALTRIAEAMPGVLAAIVPPLSEIGTSIFNTVADVATWAGNLKDVNREINLIRIGLGDLGGLDLQEVAEAGQGSGLDELTAGQARRARVVAEAILDIGSTTDLTVDQLTDLYGALDSSASVMDRFVNMGSYAERDMERLGITFGDLVEIARDGTVDVIGLDAAIEELAGGQHVRSTALVEWVNILAAGMRLAAAHTTDAGLAALRMVNAQDRLDQFADSLDALSPPIANAIDGLNNYGGVVSGLRGPDDTILATYDDLAAHVQNAVDKVGSLGSAMLELASPGLGAVRAVERFNEVYGDALADGIMTDEERAALIEPFLEVQARLGDLDGTEALAFRDIITGVWEDLGGATEDLFGEGGVMPVLIDDFGRVVAEVGPMLADNSDTWGSDLLAAMTGAVDASWPSFEDETATRADGVGRSIPRLIAEGIDAEWGLVDDALGRMPQPRMPALLPAGGAGTSGAAGAGGGVTVNVTQNNPVAERGSASLTRAGIQAAIRLQMAQRGVPGIG